MQYIYIFVTILITCVFAFIVAMSRNKYVNIVEMFNSPKMKNYNLLYEDSESKSVRTPSASEIQKYDKEMDMILDNKQNSKLHGSKLRAYELNIYKSKVADATSSKNYDNIVRDGNHTRILEHNNAVRDSLDIYNHQFIEGSNLKQYQFNFYFGMIVNSSKLNTYKQLIAKMKSNEKRDYHNRMEQQYYNHVNRIESELNSGKSEKLARAAMNAQNARDQQKRFRKRNGTIRNIDRVFSKQVQANLKQNHYENQLKRGAFVDSAIYKTFDDIYRRMYAFDTLNEK